MEEHETPAPEAGDDVAIEETDEGQVETPSAPEDAPDPEAPEDGEADADKGEKKSRSKERRARRAAYIESLERDKQDAEARVERIKRAAGGEEPKESDFSDILEYSAAKGAWLSSQNARKYEAQTATEDMQQLEEQRQREVRDGFIEQCLDAKARYKDFDAVVYRDGLPITQPMVEIMAESDMGADVAYYLGSNPHIAAQISRLPAVKAARQIGLIEASLALPQPRRQSKAPAPIAPVKASASASPDPEKMSMAEYRKWRGQ